MIQNIRTWQFGPGSGQLPNHSLWEIGPPLSPTPPHFIGLELRLLCKPGGCQSEDPVCSWSKDCPGPPGECGGKGIPSRVIRMLPDQVDTAWCEK